MKRLLSRLVPIIAPVGVMGILVGLVGACTDTDSATNLHPEGAPFIRQVRMNTNTGGSVRRVFAFGTHPLAAAEEVQPDVSNALAKSLGMRIIVDELLVGNNLEEIQCRGAVDDDAFAQVPLGANPDDIARCSVADDVLPSTCTGPTAVCICNNPAGCVRNADLIDMGKPVGVQDINQDGATDGRQMVAGAVGIRCGTIDVPIDLVNSYWNPSGDQNKPAMGGFDALGPAIVLNPLGAMPTNIECGLVFADSVVDKQGERLCTPLDPSLDANGNVKQGCSGGDLSSFHFKVEALTLAASSWADGSTGVSRTDPALFETNVAIDKTRLATVTVKQAGAAFTGFTVTNPMPTIIQITWTAPLLANTTYEITFPTTVTDTFAQPLPAPLVFTFTTGAT
jgi:hypothetical protein